MLADGGTWYLALGARTRATENIAIRRRGERMWGGRSDAMESEDEDSTGCVRCEVDVSEATR